ncbi:hypothetical protein A1O3_00568 [Capronia epimyces CBS 606.96]|uniref:Major facilitator superfamily (MFS) profile domain-containing protein n=1 Tax=Capronia epimyces CBS 606.96 TaxID=1182542 RepID=W9YHJ7_9EURO|nr:uncharacterized protein A1O3_00568 [Capronia epimyces CBS 606.96]EXJ92018.1 hypothetical protein A1O3_00568 [Capronia epimyces CBS 606.96]
MHHDEHEHEHASAGHDKGAPSGMVGFDSHTQATAGGYFTSGRFIGSMLAIGFSIASGAGTFSLPAAILSSIDADIGPDKNIVWVSYMGVLGLAVGLPLVARLSDIFGRRWYYLGGNFFMLVGAIVCATAKSVPTLVGGTVILSVASGAAFSFSFLINEIVPMKYRFIGTASGYLFALPTSGFGAAVAISLAAKSPGGWRWVYYLMMILDGIALFFFYFFYHPPTFKMKQGERSKLQMLKDLDFVGMFLFSVGIVIFLLGLSWGGVTEPWKSAGVIAPIVLGVATLAAFVAWEIYWPLKQPMVPKHLFNDRDWVVAALLLAFAASIYYALAIVWPQAVVALYAEGHGTHALLSAASTIPYLGGQITGGLLCKQIGRLKWQCFTIALVGGTLLACLATTGPHDMPTALGLLISGVFCMGWMESITQTLVGICVRNQKEIGTAVGMAGSVRSVISTIASTIYIIVLDNRLKKTLPGAVVPAVERAGLPASSIPALMAALATNSESAYDAVKGLTPQILSVAQNAYKEGSSRAYSTVFLVTLAVSGLSVVLSLIAPNVDHLMTNHVAVMLQHQKKDEGPKKEGELSELQA